MYLWTYGVDYTWSMHFRNVLITYWLSWCLHDIRAASCISVAGPDRLVWPCSFVLSSVYSSVRVSWLLVRRLSCGWGFRIFPTKPPIGLIWNLVVEWSMLCKELTRPDETIHQRFVYSGWVVHPNSRAHSFRAVKLPWIFPGAAWNFSGTPANIQGNLRGMQFGFYYSLVLHSFTLPLTVLSLAHLSVLTIIGPGNGWAPGRHQAIIWTNAGIVLNRT